MQLAELLAGTRADLLPRVLELYWEKDPAGPAFASREADPFRNPVGTTVQEAIAAIYDGLTEGKSPGELTEPVERIVQLRALQGLTPSDAVGFVLLLGRAARERLHGAAGPAREEAVRVLAALEVAERGLLLVAFDRYVACRERLQAVRMKNELARVGVLLRRAGLAGAPTAEAPPDAAEAWGGGAP